MISFKPHEAARVIAPYVPTNPIILEAGAFDGGETLRMLAQWPDCTVHAFEPVPEIFEQLTKNTQNYPNVHRYPYALSTRDGIAEFFVAEKKKQPGIASQAGSLHKPRADVAWHKMAFPRKINVEIISPQTWITKNNITQLDLLWLDMQGHELPVLQAFPKEILRTVRAIHVEVALTPRFENQELHSSTIAWLADHNFVEIARDFDSATGALFGNSLCVNKSLL